MDPQQLYNQARLAQKNGNLAEAARLYRQILSASPVPEVMVNYGNVLAQLGRRPEALAQYDQALKLRKNFFEALFNRGNLFLETGRAQDALADFDFVVAIRGDVPAVWNNRGTALRRLRRSQDALASYDRAVTLAPTHLNALTNRAIALFDLRWLEDALAAADAALAVQGDFAEALYVKGNILRDLGRLVEAQACFEQVLKATPGHAFALNGLAQMAAALCDWTKVAELTPRLASDVMADRSLIQPFVLMGYSEDAALLRRCAENYVHRMAPRQPALCDGRPYQHARIRLAYLSADFRTPSPPPS